MTSQFIDLHLRPELTQAVSALGYTEPTPIQSGIIPLMLAGIDAIGQAQTGTGKTAAFALPILNNLQTGSRLPQALVVAPTRELALQVAEAMTGLGQFCKVRVVAIYGGASYERQLSQLKRGVDVVVGTPGRLLDLLNRGALNLSEVRTVVLDEADEMLSMGFIEDIEALLSAMPAERQTSLFSATLPAPIRKLAKKYMREPQAVTIGREQMTVAAIEQRYYMVNHSDKTAALTRLFEVEEITSALIFARTKLGTRDLAAELTNRGFASEALNGDLSQESRESTLNRFRAGQIKVLVATDVAARGLDIEGISHVFNYDLSEDPEIYIHRVGRTGRAGHTGIAITLVTPAEKRRLHNVEAFIHQTLIKSTLPGVEEIMARRQGELVEKLLFWLKRGRCKQERVIVEKLVAEGADVFDLAAVAIKIARADEKMRPVAPVAEVVEITRERSGADRPGRRTPLRRERPADHADSRSGSRTTLPREDKKVSREAGMVSLSMNIGKTHGIRPADVVGALSYQADIPGSQLGKIYIQYDHTLVDVPEQFVGKVLANAGRYSIRKQSFTMARA
ncbi:MAG: DEAD/DEAH box helicase [Syntrophales bacterium]